jgi:hypothetical protein
MGEFGDKFRKARESKELSFDDVSNVIKISPRMLRAIEEEHFDQLPGGVFNKGFIRSYAKQLGLDPEEAVTEYLDQMRQAQIKAQQAWQPAPPAAETRASAPAKATTAKTAKKVESGRPKTPATSPSPVEVQELPDLQLPRAEHVRGAKKEFLTNTSSEIPWRLVAMAIVIATLGTMLWTRRSRHQNPAPSTPITATQSQPATPTSAVATPTGSTTSPTPNSGAPNSPAPNPEPPQPAPAIPPTSNPEEDKNDVTIRNFGKPIPKSSEKSSGSMMLTVRATENSWISITADGQPLTQETLIAPAHPTFRASHDFVVKVGNAAAVTFLWNGQELPAQGGEGEVKTLVFDSNGMRAVSPSQTAPATQPAPNQ